MHKYRGVIEMFLMATDNDERRHDEWDITDEFPLMAPSTLRMGVYSDIQRNGYPIVVRQKRGRVYIRRAEHTRQSAHATGWYRDIITGFLESGEDTWEVKYDTKRRTARQVCAGFRAEIAARGHKARVTREGDTVRLHRIESGGRYADIIEEFIRSRTMKARVEYDPAEQTATVVAAGLRAVIARKPYADIKVSVRNGDVWLRWDV